MINISHLHIETIADEVTINFSKKSMVFCLASNNEDLLFTIVNGLGAALTGTPVLRCKFPLIQSEVISEDEFHYHYPNIGSHKYPMTAADFKVGVLWDRPYCQVIAKLNDGGIMHKTFDSYIQKLSDGYLQSSSFSSEGSLFFHDKCGNPIEVLDLPLGTLTLVRMAIRLALVERESPDLPVIYLPHTVSELSACQRKTFFDCIHQQPVCTQRLIFSPMREILCMTEEMSQEAALINLDQKKEEQSL